MAELSDIQLRIIVQGTGLDNLQRMNDSLAKSIGNLHNSAAAANTAKSSWARFGEELSHLERKFDAVFRAASHLQALGSDLTDMGQATIGMLKESVDQWGEYEFSIHRAAGALSIFDTTSPIFHQLQQAVDDAAQEVRLFPAEEIAKAVYYWGSATGQTVETHEDLQLVMEGLIPIMQTAAITETDYESAIKGTYQIIQQYNLGLTRQATAQDVAAGAARRVGDEISNTADITQKLMMVTQNTAVEYSDLIESFKYTGSIAPALGVQYEDLLLVLGRLGDLGIRGSSAGRALQQTFSKLVDPTVRASKALNTAWENAFGLGKTFKEMVFPNGEFIGLTEYIDQLADVTEEMTQQERNQLIAIMTTQNELRTMVPLIEDQIRARKAGISVYDDEKYALENAAQQFQKTVHLLEISWKGTLGYLAAVVGPVVRLIGAEVASVATPFIEQFGQILKSVKAWLDTHPEVVMWGVRLAAVAGIILTVAGALFTAIGVLLAFGAGFAFVISSAKIFFGIFNRFLPIVGAITAAVAAGVAIWVNNFGGLRDAIENVVGALLMVIEKLNFDGVTGMGALERLADVLMPALEVAAEGVAWMLDRLADALEWIAGNDQATAVLQAILDILVAMIAISFVARMAGMALSILTLGKTAQGALLPLTLLFDAIKKIATMQTVRHPVQAFKELKAAIEIAAESAKNKGSQIKDAFRGIISVASGLPSKVGGFFTTMGSVIAGAARGITLTIRGVLIASGIGAIIVAVGILYEAWVNNWGDIQGKFAWAVDWISDRIGSFVGWITTTWNTITTRIRDAVTNIISFFQNLPTNIGNIFSQIWTNVSTWVGNIIATIIAMPGTIWQNIVTGFQNILTFLGEWWTSLGDSTAERVGYIVGVVISMPLKIIIFFYEKFAEIFTFLLEWWVSVFDMITEWVGSVVGTVIDWFAKLPGRIADLFGEIWTNLTNWWNEAIASVGRWVTSVYTSISDWIGKLPGRIANLFGQIWANVSSWWSNFIYNAGVWASNTLNAIINWLQQLPGKVAKFFSDLFTNTSTWFTTQFIPNIGTWTMNAVNAVIDWFKKLPGLVMNRVKQLVPQLLDFLGGLPGKLWSALLGIGGAIVDGIWRGIQRMWDEFWANVSGFFEGIVNGVQENLGISSPSKVFADIGEQMMAGLVVGIKNNQEAVDVLDRQVDQLIDTAERYQTDVVNPLATDFSFSTEADRKLVIEHRVSSPDGTVNAASRESLRQIFTSEDMVSALEHMATVG